MRFFYFLGRHVWSFVVVAIAFGAVYKYNRQLFFRGDYEVTYIPRVVEKACQLTTCVAGYVVELVNTGYEVNRNLVVEIENVPRIESVAIEVKQGPFRLYGTAGREPSEPPLTPVGGYDLTRTPSSLRFQFGAMPAEAMITIRLTTRFDDQNPVSVQEWGAAFVRIFGRGSALMENPYKVVVAQKLGDVVDLIKRRKASGQR